MFVLKTQTYQLPLKHPFTIARYTVETQDTLIVTISDGTYTGYGEATANPYYGSTTALVSKAVQSVASLIKNAGTLHPQELWELLAPKLQTNYFALCAIDVAFWDLYARRLQQPLRNFWSAAPIETPVTNYTIGIASPAIMKLKIAETPWPIYKIKLGTEDDFAIIKALRSVTDSVLRVDANGAWKAKEVLALSRKLQSCQVEFIEQPLAANAYDQMKALKAQSELPLIADESCQRKEDVARCAAGFHGVNIKLMKCGGITPALEMIAEARELGMTVMIGCMTESTVGISALSQLAPLVDYLDADGALLLASDIAQGVYFDKGHLFYASENGTGVTPTL